MGSRKYSTPVDVWSIGCIFAEMTTGKPLFPGQADADQLDIIFQLLGTPTPESWPGMCSLPEYKDNFTMHSPVNLGIVIPNLEPDGIDLLYRMLQFEPDFRISCEDALKHSYFDSLRQR